MTIVSENCNDRKKLTKCFEIVLTLNSKIASTPKSSYRYQQKGPLVRSLLSQIERHSFNDLSSRLQFILLEDYEEGQKLLISTNAICSLALCVKRYPSLARVFATSFRDENRERLSAKSTQNETLVNIWQ